MKKIGWGWKEREEVSRTIGSLSRGMFAPGMLYWNAMRQQGTLAVFLSAPQEANSLEVAAFLESDCAFETVTREYLDLHATNNVVSNVGPEAHPIQIAHAHFELGNYSKARQFASWSTDEQNMKLITGRCTAHRILGKICALEGNLFEAEAAFGEAQVEARESELQLYELLVARDFKHAVLDRQGRSQEGAQKVDALLARMSTSREGNAEIRRRLRL